MRPLHYGNNKPKYIRYGLYVLIISLACVFQNTNLHLPEIFGARAFLLLPLILCIAMHEREVPAAVFGAFAGVLWDVSSLVEGFNSIVIMLLSVVGSILVNRVMQNNIVSSFVLSAGAVAIYELLYIIVNLGISGAGGMVKQFVVFYLPSFAYTLVFVPVFYYITKKIYASYKTE